MVNKDAPCICGAPAVYRVHGESLSTGNACDNPTHLGELIQRLMDTKPRDDWSGPSMCHVIRRNTPPSAAN